MSGSPILTTRRLFSHPERCVSRRRRDFSAGLETQPTAEIMTALKHHMSREPAIGMFLQHAPQRQGVTHLELVCDLYLVSIWNTITNEWRRARHATVFLKMKIPRNLRQSAPAGHRVTARADVFEGYNFEIAHIGPYQARRTLIFGRCAGVTH